MAQETIDNHLITQFSDRVHVLAQQKEPRQRAHTMQGKMTGDVWAYDTLDQVEARELNARINKVEFDSIDHARRKIVRRRFTVNLPIDQSDVRGAIIAHQDKYAGAIATAMNRVFDKVVMDARFADVLTGREFDTTTTYASEGLTTVDGTAGFTYEKILEADRQFIDNEVGNDMPETKSLDLTGDEHESLMKESELTSGDFSRQFAVDKGEMVMAAGYAIIKYGASVNNPLIPVASAVRTCSVKTSRAIFVGMSKEVEIKIQNRNDFVEVNQVQGVFELGAVRTEGILINKFTATE